MLNFMPDLDSFVERLDEPAGSKKRESAWTVKQVGEPVGEEGVFGDRRLTR